MSADSTQQEPADGSAESEKASRQNMPFGQRVAILDYVRALRSPIFATTKAEAAKQIAEALGFEVSWSQLKYIIEAVPEMNLQKNLVIGDEADRNLTLRVVALEAELKQLRENVAELFAKATLLK